MPADLMRPAVKLRWHSGRVMTYHRMRAVVADGLITLTPVNRTKPLFVFRAEDLAHYDYSPARS